jgi:gamma-glutamyltranspeptidase/glutathione hydrolase
MSRTLLSEWRCSKKGDVFKNPNLANTLEKIAKGGRDVFYKVEIAKTIDAFLRKTAVILSLRDLADHTSTWVDPVSTNYRG